MPGFELLPETFEELRIPLKIVACDFYAWTEAILIEGPLQPGDRRLDRHPGAVPAGQSRRPLS